MEVQGLDKLLKRINRISTSIQETSDLYQSIGDALESEAQRSIREQKSATTNRRYAPLKPSTQEEKNKGPDDALKSRKGTIKIISMRILGKGRAEFITTMPYASVHQYGNPRNRYYGNKAPIPRRPFIPVKENGELSDRMKNKLNEILSEWLVSKVSGTP